jgi:hypothetical protein
MHSEVLSLPGANHKLPWHTHYPLRNIKQEAADEHRRTTAPCSSTQILDGSQKVFLRRFRWVGAYKGHENLQQHIGLGGAAEVYEAELTGLAHGLRLCSNNNVPDIKSITIYYLPLLQRRLSATPSPAKDNS